MAKEYIERNALIAEYDRVHVGPPGGARKLMEDAPTADVAEVKHGYWYTIDSDVGWELVGCSECRGEYSLCDGEDRTDYCPYCGAKMDGGRGERKADD